MKAIGLLETKGLVPAMAAMDEMKKAVEGLRISVATAGAGIVTVSVEAEVSKVQVAMDAAVGAAKQVGEILALEVISKPHDSVNGISF